MDVSRKNGGWAVEDKRQHGLRLHRDALQPGGGRGTYYKGEYIMGG